MKKERCENCQHWGSVLEKVFSDELVKYCWVENAYTDCNYSCNLFFPIPEEE